MHRDLKPENLLLSDPSDSAILKIADFGLSAVIFAGESTMVASSAVQVGGNTSESDMNQHCMQPMRPTCLPATAIRKADNDAMNNGRVRFNHNNSLDAQQFNHSGGQHFHQHAMSTPPPKANSNSSMDIGPPSSFRRLRSVVGSPHYIAPEIAHDGKPIQSISALCYHI